MRKGALLVAVAAVSLGFAPAPFQKVKPTGTRNDLTVLQGTWVYHSGKAWGHPYGGEETSLRFSGTHLDWAGFGYPQAYSVQLGRSQQHKAIDLLEDDTGKPRRGIYKLEGDVLTVCDDVAGAPRPEGFDGQKYLLVVYKRLKR